ncbi:MAG: BTAD domain-containing putative transcriptional regulator [Gemmatimonadales bacterium]
MPRLITFGSPTLLADDGSTPLSISPQRLALLAVVAASAPRGVTRERLLGLFWPDSEEEDARHSLRQALYALRQEFGRDPVRITGAELRLDGSVVSADIAAFHAAVTAGDRAKAADLFSGRFLDGFYLRNAPELERWVEEQRTRLSTQAASVIESLAREAEAAGDHDSAVKRRRQLMTIDPLSGRHAMAYMRALSARGDQAEALAFARVHEAVVRRELDADPDPQVQQLVRELRARVPPEIPTRSAAGSQRLPAEAIASTRAAPTDSSPPRPRLRLGLIAAAGAVIMGTAAFALYRLTRSAPPRVMAVGLVAESGIPESLRIGGVLTDMLATNLGRIEGLAVLANSRLLEMIEPGQERTARGYADAARRAGATEIVEGRLLPGPAAGLALELSRIDLRRGLVRNAYRIAATDRYALVDSATAAIAGDLGLRNPIGSVAATTTQSPIAYRLYEEGLRAYFQGDTPGAYRLLRTATEEDPEFVMPLYYASLSALNLYPDSVEGLLRRAQALAARSPARVRYLISARYLWLTQERRAVAVADTLAVLLPDDPEAQRLVGNIRSFDGDYTRSVAAFDRAVALDSAMRGSTRTACRLCTALAELSNVYEGWDSLAAVERTLRRWVRLRPNDPRGWLSLEAFLEQAGRWEEARVAAGRGDSLGGTSNEEIPIVALIKQGLYDEAEFALSSLLVSSGRETRGRARWLLFIVLRNRGRLREAAGLNARAGSPSTVLPESDTLSSDPINKAILAFEMGRYREAAGQFYRVSQGFRTDRFAGRRARNISWWLALSATASAAAGDTMRVRILADSIEQFATRSLNGRDRRLPFFLRGLLAARQGRQTEALTLLRQAVHSASVGYTRINYELARTLLALDRPLEAVGILQPALRGGIEASNLYITRTELHELLAQAWDRVGLPDSAAVHYRAVVRAWDRADPPFQPRVAAAQAWLARYEKRSA